MAATTGLGMQKAQDAAGNAHNLRLQAKALKNEALLAESAESKMDNEANAKIQENAAAAMKARVGAADKITSAFTF